VQLVPELTTRDAVAHDMEGPGVATTQRSAFLEFHSRMCGAIPDLRFEILDTIAEGDCVVLRIHNHGTHTGGDLGVRPTGNRIDFGAIVILRFQDGKIAESWNFIDQLSFYQQLRILDVR
jgi:predicted ester cyclase